MQGVLAPVLDDLGVTFRVMKGFGSFTAVMQAAEDATRHAAKATVALYIGDWDPTGLYMSEVDLPERLERYGGQRKLKRIAIVKADTRRLPHFDVATKAERPALPLVRRELWPALLGTGRDEPQRPARPGAQGHRGVHRLAPMEPRDRGRGCRSRSP